MNERSMRPRSGSSAKAVLLTLLGEFVLPRDGSVWTSTVVRLLGACGVEERNARQANLRLAEQGLLRSEKEGRRSRWHLTGPGRGLLTAGRERIYRFGSGEDTWNGRWLVVLCSVPEDQRAKRHRLRSQLGFAGFGFLGPGVAVSPHVDREETANAVLEDLGLLHGAVVLLAETGAVVAPDDLLGRAWDLDALGAGYETFIADFGRRPARSDEARFVALVDLVHAWRRFPFVDPEIPPRLLPPGWPGRRAKDVFDAQHAAWAPAANTWYEAAEAG